MTDARDRPTPGLGDRDDPAGPWSSRWHRATGLVLVVYLLFILIHFAVLRTDPGAFNRMSEIAGSVFVRLVSAVVAVALVFHALSGVRVIVLELARPAPRFASQARLAVVFLTALSVLPLAALLLRPVIESQ